MALSWMLGGLLMAMPPGPGPAPVDDRMVRSRRAAIGLWSGAGVATVGAIGLRVGSVLALAPCRSDETGLGPALGCAGAGASSIGFVIGAESLSALGVGLGAGGGVLLGQADGVLDVRARRSLPRRRDRAVGASLVGTGAAIMIATTMVEFLAAPACGWECRPGAHLATELGRQAGWMTLTGGAALWAYGDARRRVALRLSPSLARDHVGLTLRARF